MNIEIFDERQYDTEKVFFTVTNNTVSSVIVGNQAVATGKGHQFHVKNYVADQIGKCELYFDGLTPKLRVKEGEAIDEPVLTEKEIQMNELKRQMFELENETDAE